MDTWQKWVVGIVGAVVASAIGAVVYTQFATAPGIGGTSGESLSDFPSLTGGAATEASEDAVPAGEVSVDDVARGISGDLDREDISTDTEVSAEKSDATGAAESLKDLENSYEEGSL
ncbi:MAG: hypothetical protein HGA38_04485 [Candidatus Moranbacteria bacterium]|nr:hypothetical protein [Candidatus Moranbacteria bacterium]NTW45919.1 hypothetical protein [Candidatus Moranbacteria bacterium]